MAKLYFRYGSMNCGKSANLLMVAHNYIDEKNKKILIVKPNVDTKGDNQIVCRMGSKRKVDILLDEKDKLINFINEDLIKELDAILIDEVQFLSQNQIDELHQIAHVLDIPVICYGLRCDFKMMGFPGATRLLEIADSIEEIKTICDCGKKATQNIRLINGKPTFSGNQVVIDDCDTLTYKSVCNKDYYEIREKYDPNFVIDEDIKRLKYNKKL